LLRLCSGPRAEAIRSASVKLLLDQNLSGRIISRINDLFPGSRHIKAVGLREADDGVVWEWAKQHGFTIASKDTDFSSAGYCVWSPAKGQMATRWKLPDSPACRPASIVHQRAQPPSGTPQYWDEAGKRPEMSARNIGAYPRAPSGRRTLEYVPTGVDRAEFQSCLIPGRQPEGFLYAEKKLHQGRCRVDSPAFSSFKFGGCARRH